MASSLDSWGEQFREEHQNPLFALTKKNPANNTGLNKQHRPSTNPMHNNFMQDWGWVLDD